MKTIIKTNIKDNTNVQVKEEIEEIFHILMKKGAFIMLTRISFDKQESSIILSKGSIKMIRKQRVI